VRRPAALAVLAALLVAGCTASTGGKASAAGGHGDPLAAGLAFRGVVVDEAIRPLAGVNVTLSTGASNTTNGKGEFAFAGLPEGTLVLKAHKRGFADSTTQVDLSSTRPAPPVKLVMVADASTVAYVDAYAIDGFVECGVYFVVGYFAACSLPNTLTTIACPATHVCLGNVTGDRSLILEPMGKAPTWVQMEAAWDATVDTAKVMMVQSGATTEEEVAAGGVRIINQTIGPSPNLNIIAGKALNDSRIGVDPGSLLYMRLHTAPNPPASVGFAVEQPFKLLIHVFYGYTPPPGWRFSETNAVPPPPA